jgi:hypothetical protein
LYPTAEAPDRPSCISCRFTRASENKERKKREKYEKKNPDEWWVVDQKVKKIVSLNTTKRKYNWTMGTTQNMDRTTYNHFSMANSHTAV